MKISKIEIKDYQQFKGVVLDFTYPIGHKKEGKPLDKICFIGQSGTGKTTLLRLIKYFVSRNRRIGINLDLKVPIKDTVLFEIHRGDLLTQLTVDEEFFWVNSTKKNDVQIDFNEYIKEVEVYEDKIKPLLINYPAEVLRGEKKNIIQLTKEQVEEKVNDKLEFINNLQPQQILDFNVENIEDQRDFVFKEIKDFQTKELEMLINTTDSVLREKWYKKNENPLKELANKCLNPILKKIGLKVKVDFDLKAILEHGDIQLQTLDGVDVERNFWSTGTRQIVDTLLPLFELKPKNAVVLMDEPEKSLYPDVQEEIISIYQGLAPECQFFFATHSPIIASSFDPWEIFQLEYDNFSNKVYLIKNYEGDRHIDNFKYYTKSLRWDSILMEVFKISDEGNNERQEMLLELAIIKRDLEDMILNKKQKLKSFQKKKEEFLLLSKKVGWDAKNI